MTINRGKLYRRDRVLVQGMEYRVLDFYEKKIYFIKQHSRRINVLIFEVDECMKMIVQGDIKVIQAEKETVFFGKVDDGQRAIADRRKEVLDKAIGMVFPDYECFQHKGGKEVVEYIKRNLSIQETQARTLLHRYLECAFDNRSLFDQRMIKRNRKTEAVTGRKNQFGEHSKVRNDEELEEHFHKAYDYFHENAKFGMTLVDAYEYLLTSYYMENGELLPEEYVPSFRRFYYYILTQLQGSSVRSYKKSERERFNNERLTGGSYSNGAYFPGEILEIDEVELDLEIVRSEPVNGQKQNIGRPIIYFIIDIVTQLIVAFSCALDNNSYVGFLNVFETLLTPHSEQAKVLGIDCDDTVFPSCFLPKVIRSDQGAEYVSEVMKENLSHIGVRHEFVPPATGSRKGIVESSFHSLQTDLRSVLHNSAGIIRKSYSSTHKKTARMTLDELRRYLYIYVQNHNTSPLQNYQPTPDEIRKGIKLTPINLWNYRLKGTNVVSSREVLPSEVLKYRFELMCYDKPFFISRDGITHGSTLYYWTENRYLQALMRKAGDKRVKIKEVVRYDPRSIDHIYMVVDGKIEVISLNLNKGNLCFYQGYDWKSYDAEMKAAKLQKDTGSKSYEGMNRRIQFHKECREIDVDYQQKECCKKNLDKNKREERKKEKLIEDKKGSENRNSIYSEQIEFADVPLANKEGDITEKNTTEKPLGYYDFFDR